MEIFLQTQWSSRGLVTGIDLNRTSNIARKFHRRFQVKRRSESNVSKSNFMGDFENNGKSEYPES